ncbi:exo-alpha-sialidase [Parapedobacter sp. GCM10030251]|uniref:sialidase family protein n=1 Tax=Parapedobacter sp. GCM10030251 TaxID=3273419 RepID=UPI00366BF165
MRKNMLGMNSVAIVVCLLCLLPVERATAQEGIKVFEPKSGAYSSTRIPALVLTKKGTLLAFAAGRIESASDWADMDLLVRRSEDGGNTWGPIQVVAERAGSKPTDNPTPIVGADGTIHLLYQRDYAYAYYTQSTDDGLTWSPAVNITPTFDAFKEDYDWKVLAPGPGHSIQLENGRLLVPVWLADSDKLKPHRSHRPSRIATIYSDDNGKTWQRGALVPDAEGFKNPSETMAVELPDGRVMLSIRNESEKRRKGVSYSKDGISDWTTPSYDEGLFEPICMSSILATPYKGTDYLLFLNPDSENIPKHPRQNLTLKVSADNGKTWPVEHVVNAGISGYSDLAIGPDGTIYCLFETKLNPKDSWSLVLKRLTLDKLVK